MSTVVGFAFHAALTVVVGSTFLIVVAMLVTLAAAVAYELRGES